MNIKHLVLFLILSLGLAQCTQVKQQDIRRIEGYWEIESVQSHGETFQPKGAAPSVDYYFFSTDTSGIKKKLSPRMIGQYETSEDQVAFVVREEKGAFALHFQTPLETWKEEIKEISADRLILFHNDMEYHYKRHKKIEL